MKLFPRSPSLRRFVRSFVLVFSVPLILIVLGFFWIGRGIVTYVEETNRGTLVHAAESIENFLGDISTISRQLSLDPRILTLKYRNEGFDRAAIQIVFELQRDLTFQTISHGLIHQLYLYFEQTSTVVGAHAVEPADFFYKNRLHFEGYSYEEWRSTFLRPPVPQRGNQPGLVFFPEVQVFIVRGGRRLLPVVAGVSIPPERPVYALYLLEPNAIRSILETVIPDPASGTVYLTSPQGTRLLHHGASPSGFQSDGGTLARYSLVGESGITYTAIQPAAVLLRPIQSTAVLAVVTLALAVAAGFVFAVLLAQRAARPIDAILGKLGDEPPSVPSTNPLEDLERRFSETLDHAKYLEQSLAFHRSLALAGLVERLLRGYGDPEDARAAGLGRYLSLDATAFRAVIVRFEVLIDR